MMAVAIEILGMAGVFVAGMLVAAFCQNFLVPAVMRFWWWLTDDD